MKTKIVFLFLFLLFIRTSFADVTDSLKTVLNASREDTAKVNVLIALSKNLFSSSPGDAYKYASDAKVLALKLNYFKGVAYALKNLGIVNYNQGKYIDAIDNWEQSLKMFQSIGDKVGVANMQSNLGVLYNNVGDNTMALEFNLKALQTAEELKDTLRMATVMQNIGIVYIDKKTEADLKKAMDYFHKALPLAEGLKDKDLLGAINVNIGEVYFNQAEAMHRTDSNNILYDSALLYFQKSLKEYDENSENLPYPLNYVGKLYLKQGSYDSSIYYHQQANEIAKKLDLKLDIAQSLIGLAQAYKKKGDLKLALATFKEAEQAAKDVEANKELKDIYEGMGAAYAEQKDFTNAFKYQTLLLGIRDNLYNLESEKKFGNLGFAYENKLKQTEVNLLTIDKQLKEKEISRQKIVRNSFVGGFAIVLVFAGIFFRQRNRISKEKKRSEELLLNILPEETAEELKHTGTARTKSFDSVSVLFTDFKNFTQASEKLTPEELVAEINHCYSEFDKIVTRHGIEKIKTIGDSYMCAGGLPIANSTHAEDVVKAGLEMVAFIEENKKVRIEKGMPYFELRCGIHTGPVVAGIVGIKKFAYDIWGDTVNTASRMESSGAVGKVNISGSTYELVKDKFKFQHRGKVEAKNKGLIDMYFVEG